MNEEVRALKSELALVKLQFSQRLSAVESRLDNLLGQYEIETEQYSQTVTESDKNYDDYLKPIPLNSNGTPPIQVASNKATPLKENVIDEVLPSAKKMQRSVIAVPSFITVLFQAILSSFFEWFSPVTQAYQSYKARGMLGIFTLTIVGIALILAGFGYLMQLLIDQLGAGQKSLLMSFAAVLVMGLGIGLKIKTRYGEFATAIVTLGILLSYSTVYFSGSIYTLIPNIAVLSLYLVIALVCHVLALWLDTKVVAALGIIGIATMPVLSNVINIEPIYYLLSLAFVVASSLILSYKHVGSWLAHLSLAFTLVSLEWLVGFENIILSAWLINVFYLLFFTYVCFALYKEDTAIKKPLVFLAALVGATVLLFWQATELFTTQISASFALNTLIAIFVSFFFYKVKRELTHFFILLVTAWAILTIVSAISNGYWGIAWAVEGILLLSIGRRYKFSTSIHQGQILTAIALLYSLSALAMYFPLPALKSIDGWVLSIMIVAIIALWQRLIDNSDTFDHLTKTVIKPLLQLLEVIWITVLLIASADVWLGEWTGALVILMQVASLFRAKHCQNKVIEIFAALLIVVPLFYAYQGVMLVDSYRFTLLPMFAKVALISAFSQLWLWSSFYRKYQADSAMKKFSEAMRIAFYMIIPICWLGSVIRRFEENSLMLLWLSPLLALILARKVNHKLLFTEAKILTGLASLALVLAIEQLSLLNSLIALLGFTVYYVTAYFLNRKGSMPFYQFVCSWGVLTFGFALPILISEQTDDLFYGLISAALYWAIAFNMMSLSEHLKRNETFISLVNILLLVIGWVLIQVEVIYSLAPLILLLALLYQKEQRFKVTKLCSKLKLNGDLFLHSIGVITYVSVLYSLDMYRFDLLIAPVLAVHGAMILFLKDRRITTVKYSFGLILLGIVKLALVDAANALLWQKVMLFMGIGVFILLASFWYQKLSSTEKVATPELKTG